MISEAKYFIIWGGGNMGLYVGPSRKKVIEFLTKKRSLSDKLTPIPSVVEYMGYDIENLKEVRESKGFRLLDILPELEKESRTMAEKYSLRDRVGCLAVSLNGDHIDHLI